MTNKQDIQPDYTKKEVWSLHEQNLNRIVNHNQINKPKKSIYIMKLIDDHDLKSSDEVLDSLAQHRSRECSCGQQMTNSLKDLAEEMYEKQTNQMGFKVYTRSTCFRYLKDLFTRKSLQGSEMETRAIELLRNREDKLTFEMSNGQEDNTHAIDVKVMTASRVLICAIQIKPDTYDKHKDKSTKQINKIKNDNYEHPVFYLTYSDNKEFKNVDEVVNQINQLVQDLQD